MIIVFGSLNVDIVMPVETFPALGETVLCSTDYLSRAGGKGSNQAVAAARAGTKVAFVGKVGDDSFGRRSVNNLKNNSVWTTGVGMSDRPTGCATIAVDNKGSNFIMVAPGANLEATNDQIPDEVFIPKNLILAQLEITPDETAKVLSRAHALGATTILNASPARHLPKGILKDVDYVIANELEARQLAKNLDIVSEDPHFIARAIAKDHKTICIITMEDKGCIAAKGTDLFHVPAYKIELVDSTGAGDTFCGVFAAYLQKGSTWLEALHRASIGAGLSCLGLGPQGNVPTHDSIEELLGAVPMARKVVTE